MELSVLEIIKRIYNIRGSQVMIDTDLAILFDTEVRILNQSARRNARLFPSDFTFQLNKAEYGEIKHGLSTYTAKHGAHRKYLPHAYTESGVATLSSILKTSRAVTVHIAAVRAFTQIRQQDHPGRSNEARFDRQDRQILLILEKMEVIAHSIANLTAPQSNTIPIASPPGALKIEGALPIQSAIDGDRSQILNIIQGVAKYFELTLSDFKSANRRRAIAVPRQIAIYLIRKHTGAPYKDIGDYFGGKDHSTILFAYKKIESAIRSEPGSQISRIVFEMEKLLLK